MLQLLNMYAHDNDVVYDPFVGTGTTMIGCMKYNNGENGLTCIGSELSNAQIDFAKERINNFKKESENELFGTNV